MPCKEILKKTQQGLRLKGGKVEEEKITYITIQYRYGCISNAGKTAVKRKG